MQESEKQLRIKEFKKWSGKNCKNGNCPARSGHEISCTACENLQENAWRAALGWALSNKTSVCYSLPVVLADLIEKELK